jgi:hypothetical protein
MHDDMALKRHRIPLPRTIGPQVAVDADPGLLKRFEDFVTAEGRLVGELCDKHRERRAVVIAFVRPRHLYRLPAHTHADAAERAGRERRHEVAGIQPLDHAGLRRSYDHALAMCRAILPVGRGMLWAKNENHPVVHKLPVTTPQQAPLHDSYSSSIRPESTFTRSIRVPSKMDPSGLDRVS